MWAVQLALAFMQAKRFQADLKSLRMQGTSAVGMGGRRYRGGRAFKTHLFSKGLPFLLIQKN
jgi:DNA-binding transcriptional regulator of glucitol operon